MRFELFFIFLFACAPWIPEKLPVSVEIDKSMPEVFIRDTRSAFITWNAMADRKVFQIVVKKLSKDSCDKIQVTTETMDISKRLGTTRADDCGAKIYIADQLPESGITQVTSHEAGHALGLQHSPDITSIMYENFISGQLFTDEMLDYVRYW